MFVCLHHYRSHPSCLLHPAPASLPLWPAPHRPPCLWVMQMCSWTNPFPFFHPVPLTLPQTIAHLFYVSTALFLFCSSAYFVHEIPHLHEVMWYWSFYGRLMSLSTVISRYIHAVTKGESSFFFTATEYLRYHSVSIHSSAAGH